MVRTVFMFFALMFSAAVFAQDTLPPGHSVIPVDLDGDGQLEQLKITEYLVKKPCDMCPAGNKTRRFIKYTYPKGNDTITFFEHEYTQAYTYGISRFEDLNYDRLIDAIYFQSNDVEQETVIIINRKDSTEAFYLGKTSNDFPYEVGSELMVTMVPPTGGFIQLAAWQNNAMKGTKARWVRSTAVMYSQPNEEEPIDNLEAGTILITGKAEEKEGWTYICFSTIMGEQCGWIKNDDLTQYPPQKIFK